MKHHSRPRLNANDGMVVYAGFNDMVSQPTVVWYVSMCELVLRGVLASEDMNVWGFSIGVNKWYKYTIRCPNCTTI